MATEKIRCEKCGSTMASTNFYKKRDGSFFSYCKKCLTLHLDVFKEDTYLWILEEADVPYIKKEWYAIRNKVYADNPRKVNTTLGKYLSKMKLKQHKEQHYADSDAINAQNDAEEQAYLAEHPEAQLKKQELKDKYNRGLISEAQYRTLSSAETLREGDVDKIIADTIAEQGGPMPAAFSTADTQEFMGPGANLSDDDKMYLAIKWGTTYHPNEWVALEKNYMEMTESFDIRDADSINSLKMLCKANLKANQAIDMNDFDGFQKLSKVADSLRKSAKWTALQNKDDLDGGMNAIGKIVTFCEKEGGAIPRFDLSIEQDVIDTIINDNKAYVKSLFYSDPSLATQVENYLAKRELLDEEKRQKELALAAGGTELVEEEQRVTDADIAEYKALQEDAKKHDSTIYTGEADNT